MNTTTHNEDQYLAHEAIAMMENGRPTPIRQKRRLIEGLARDFTATYIHFGNTRPDPFLKPGATQ